MSVRTQFGEGMSCSPVLNRTLEGSKCPTFPLCVYAVVVLCQLSVVSFSNRTEYSARSEPCPGDESFVVNKVAPAQQSQRPFNFLSNL